MDAINIQCICWRSVQSGEPRLDRVSEEVAMTITLTDLLLCVLLLVQVVGLIKIVNALDLLHQFGEEAFEQRDKHAAFLDARLAEIQERLG